MISIKLQSNFIEIALRHECSPVNLLHIFITPVPRNTSEWLFLEIVNMFSKILYSPNVHKFMQSYVSLCNLCISKFMQFYGICFLKIFQSLLWSHTFRGRSRTAATSKMERFVIIVNGFQLNK